MRLISYGLFAVGIMLAVSGGAKLPPPVTRPSLDELMQGIDSGEYVLGRLRDVTVGSESIVARYVGESSDDKDPDSLWLSIDVTDDDREDVKTVLARLEDAAVAFQVSPSASPPVFPDTLPFFLAGILMAVAGVACWRLDVHRRAAAETSDGTSDGHDPLRLLAGVIKPAQRLEAESGKLDAQALTEEVDRLLEDYVLPLAEVRREVIDHFGMSTGAEILVTVAVGERMLNRTWSAAADGHIQEARACYPEAVRAFEQAERLVQEALAQHAH
jgi:hypothetical protein